MLLLDNGDQVSIPLDLSLDQLLFLPELGLDFGYPAFNLTALVLGLLYVLVLVPVELVHGLGLVVLLPQNLPRFFHFIL